MGVDEVQVVVCKAHGIADNKEYMQANKMVAVSL